MNSKLFKKAQKFYILVNYNFSVVYFGAKIFKTFSLWMVDVLTWKSCVFNEYSSTVHNSSVFIKDLSCSNEVTLKKCTDNGGDCEIFIDGYFIEVSLNITFGIFWFFWARRVIKKLQKLPLSDWHVLSNKNRRIEGKEETLPLKEF